MPKKITSQAEVKTTQEQAPAGPPQKAEQVILPKSARQEEPRTQKTASSPSTSDTSSDAMKAHKSQEETPSQRQIDSQKPEKELTKAVAPEKKSDDKPQKVHDEPKLKPKITIAETQEKQTAKRPQKDQEEIKPKPTLKTVPRKPLDEMLERGQEGTNQNATLTSVPGEQSDEKIEKRRDDYAEKERALYKEIIEGKPSESRKPGNGVVEKSMVTEKEIRARRELAKANEHSIPKSPKKKKETTSKTAATVVINEWNLNDGMIDTIGKGIKEVAASASTAFTRIAEGKWDDEDKPLLLNMGASILVLAAVGIYAFYRFSSSERT